MDIEVTITTQKLVFTTATAVATPIATAAVTKLATSIGSAVGKLAESGMKKWISKIVDNN